MDGSLAFMLLLQLVLIALNAVFACAEIAVIQINDAKLSKLASQGDKRAVRLAKLTSQPAKFLSTIQVAITLSGFLGSAFAAENFSDVIVNWLVDIGVKIPVKTLDSIAVIVITIILSYVTLVLGELVPKQVAMRKSESLALGMSGFITAMSKLFAPIVWLLTISTNAVLRLLGIDPNAEQEEVSEEEIRMMVDVGSEKGTIDHEEKEFIQNVFEFDDLTAGEIATHRTDLDLLYMEDSMDEWHDLIKNSRHTRYPICEESADNIVGILNSKDYLRLDDRSRENVMKNAVYPAYFVPESVKADVLFRNMKRTRNIMAVVLDEFGGVNGIITINDLVEQLVGDIGDDESELEEEVLIEKTGDGVWRIHGTASLEDISEELNIPLPSDDYDTLNGLVFDVLGTIPQDGTSFEIDAAGMHIVCSEIEDHQIGKAVVSLIKKEKNDEAEEE